MNAGSDPAITGASLDELERLRAEIRDLRSQLEAKTRIATRAMATYQQRALQMEEHAAELQAANEQVRKVNERLSETLRTLEERDRMITTDLEQARRFQELILPAPPESEHVAFSVFYRPAELVGGDVYDIHEVKPGVFRVFLADATGHGVQAALRTMLLKAEYERFRDAAGPEHTLSALNASLTRNYPGLEMQCSAACFDLILGNGSAPARVRYATAAHPPLVVVRDGTPTSMYHPGPFIGVVPTIELEPVEIEVEPGHRLLLYSDGLEDQLNATGTEFGLERVAATVGDCTRDLSTAVGRLVSDWNAFLDGARAGDDATLIALECLR